MVILDAARAFRRLAPMALAELATHAQLAHNASYQVTVAAREAYMQQLPWLRLLQCSAGFRNPRADAGTRKASLPVGSRTPLPERQLPSVDAQLRVSVPRGW